MIQQQYSSSERLEDYREFQLIPPVELLWESTRHRLYGILLKEHPKNKDMSLKVKEYVMTGSNSLDSPKYVEPVYPGEHPGLLYLHADASAEERYKLFTWAVSPSLDYQSLMGLDSTELGVVAMLHKIQHEQNPRILQDWEVFVFLVQFYVLKKLTAQDIKMMPNMVPSARSAHLAALFTSNLTLLQLNWALGGMVPTQSLLPYSQFDGKLFQTQYRRGKNCTVSGLLNEIDDILNKFPGKFCVHSMKDKIESMLRIVRSSK